MIREDKRGYIPGETPRILERLNIDPEQFIATAARMLHQFSTAILGQVRQEIEIVFPGLHLKGDAAVRVSVHEQDAVAQHAVGFPG